MVQKETCGGYGMIKPLLLTVPLVLAACSDTAVYWYGKEPSSEMLERLSDRFADRCGIPMLFIPVEISEADSIKLYPDSSGGDYMVYYEPTVTLTSESQAVTKMVINTKGWESVGLYFGPAPLRPYIHITWPDPAESTLEHIIMHEIGHRFTLPHVPESPENTMYNYVINGQGTFFFNDEQWDRFCSNYLTQTENRIKRFLNSTTQKELSSEDVTVEVLR